MVREFVWHELEENIKSPRAISMLLVAISLIPVSGYLNYRALVNSRNSLSMLRENYKQEFLQTPWNRIIKGDTPILGFREPSYLFAFSNGIEAELPITVEFGRLRLRYTYQNEGTASGVLRKVDLEEIIGIIFSLLALFFTHNAVSGEKESGTLRLILANNIARHEILLGKLIGNVLLLSVPLLAGFLMGMTILGLHDSAFISGQVLLRTGLLLIPSLLFLFVVVSFGILVSCLTLNSKTSLALSFLLWTFFVLVVPNISRLAGPLLRPVEPEYVHERAITAKMEEYKNEKSERLREIYQRYMVDPSNEEFWKKYADLRSPIIDEIDGKYERQLEALEEDYYKRKLDQKMTILALSRISPLSSFRYMFSSICGTSDLLEEEFFNWAKLRQKMLAKGVYGAFINDSVTVEPSFRDKVPNTVIGNIRGAQPLNKDEIVSDGLWSPRNLSVRSILIDFIWLMSIGLAFFISSYFAFIKYDVR